MNITRLLQRLGATLFLASGLMLTGCSDVLTSVETVDHSLETFSDSKLRHEKFLSRSKRMGKEGEELLLNVSTLEKMKVLERYRVVERYKVVERYDLGAVIRGGAAITIIDTTGSGDFKRILDLLKKDREVRWLEPDFKVKTPRARTKLQTLTEVIPWGTKLVGGTSSWESGTGAEAPHVYVLDSGIASSDVNVVERVDFQLDGASGDPDGHGTHIAGTIAAKKNNEGLLGVAPGVAVHDFRVLDANGLADISMVIAAVQRVTEVKLANPSRPMVVNMSLGEDIGTTEYTALDEAIEASIATGVIYVIAAGNAGADASNFTPAHVTNAITVGAYTKSQSFAYFSNHGPVLDTLAPGESILSLSTSGGLDFMSGTSMATAHVTGIVARFLGANPSTSPEQMESKIRNATSSETIGISGVPDGTVSRGAKIFATTDLAGLLTGL